MKLSEQPSRIVGVMVGEILLNIIRSDLPPFKVKFALLGEDSGPIGFSDVGAGYTWSEKTRKAIQALIDAVEEDGLHLIFKMPTQDTEKAQTEERSDPPQF